ncbi:hypothetical protein SNE40_001807 [Patella caerulea]|uniref:Uncharacterized protein n=1 Tax=Patella caerulea TaxID=87958 RepID=A0AAN8KBS1_PATCE
MDFAENYTCRSVDEIQSAYWHQTAITLHPAVAYFKLDGSLQHRSFVVISNELAHNTSTVWSILDILVPQLKQIDANLEYIHYWTDSPSSQYRNKHIFQVIANHVELFNVAARWNYFEAGHGKGPCDGLGGATKRFADEAIKMGAAVIQDAADFFTWASTSTMREVTFLWLERDACQQKLEVTSCLKIKPIKGTMKYHAVSSNDTRSIIVGETSCYCHDCLTGEVCSHWDLHILDYKRNTTVRDEQQQQQSVPNTTNNDIIHETVDSNTGLQQVACKDGDFVACVYDKKWYIGFVSEEDDDDVNVSFMQASKAMFKWPQP